MSRVTQDEHGVVSVYNDDGSLAFFTHRQNYDALCRSFGKEPVEPERVTSGGGIVYGIKAGATPPDDSKESQG